MPIAKIGAKDANAFDNFMAAVEKQEQGEYDGIIPPWPTFASIIGHFGPGEVTVFAGTEGAGKTWFSLALCAAAEQQGKKWEYIPLEEDVNYYIRRFLAFKDQNWDIASRKQEHAAAARESAERNRDWIERIKANILQNPRLAGIGTPGDMGSLPDLPYMEAVDRVRTGRDLRDLIIIDPVTMLDFNIGPNGEVREFEGQNDFIKELVGVVSNSRCHVVIVLHYTKGTNNIQGGAGFTRFAHNVIKLNHHDEIESDVLIKCGYTGNIVEQTAEHKRTLRISKARNGPEGKANIAVELTGAGPMIQEIGIISGKSKRRK